MLDTYKIIRETPKTVILELRGKRKRLYKTTYLKRKAMADYFFERGLDSFKKCMKDINDYLKTLPAIKTENGNAWSGSYITITNHKGTVIDRLK